jgi:hypothetical protein
MDTDLRAHARDHCSQRTTTSQACSHDLRLIAKEAKLEAFVRAGCHTVQAKMALGLVPLRASDGIVAALTFDQAPVAVVARGCILMQTQNRPSRSHAQQRAQRTQRPAPEARHPSIHRQQRKKDYKQQYAQSVMRHINNEVFLACGSRKNRQPN